VHPRLGLSTDYADDTDGYRERPAPAAKRPVAARSERREYEPRVTTRSYSRRSFLTVRGSAAPPDGSRDPDRRVRIRAACSILESVKSVDDLIVVVIV